MKDQKHSENDMYNVALISDQSLRCTSDLAKIATRIVSAINDDGGSCTLDDKLAHRFSRVNQPFKPVEAILLMILR